MSMSMSSPSGDMLAPGSKDYVDLHELAKGWKAAIARAKDPATKYVIFGKWEGGPLTVVDSDMKLK